jgi:hypothetical protein
LCIALIVKTTADHITGPNGLCKGALYVQEFFFSGSLLSTYCISGQKGSKEEELYVAQGLLQGMGGYEGLS